MTVNAFAKINWTLNVLGARPDGYHELDMLMQSASLCDDIEIEDCDEIKLDISGREARTIGAGPDNLIMRAAMLLKRETGARQGAAMRLKKRIPAQAGLGGGSSDAAAALKALNLRWHTGLSLSELCVLGAKLGADIPYCLTGGLCRAQGVGERITQYSGAPECDILIAMPAASLKTADVFKAGRAYPAQNMAAALAALKAGDWEYLRQNTANDLQYTAQRLRPEIAECVRHMYASGAAFARMTGSGSAVFAVFDYTADRNAAFDRLKKLYPVSILARTLP